jgi:hypothetical protein
LQRLLKGGRCCSNSFRQFCPILSCRWKKR